MKASIGTDRRLNFWFDVEAQQLLGLKVVEQRLRIERKERLFLFTIIPAETSEVGLLTPMVRLMSGSDVLRAGVSLSAIGMEEVTPRRSRDIGKAILVTPIDTLPKVFSIELPEIFFSTIPDDHAAKARNIRINGLKLTSKTAAVKTSVSCLNEFVAKGEVSLRLKNGYLLASFMETIGGDPTR